MDLSVALDEAAGQATFEMANLRQARTGLPFVVFISQKGNYQHHIRVKVSQGPPVAPSHMGKHALRPFRYEGGTQLSSTEEKMLERWVEKTMQTLVEYWDGDFMFTEEAIDRIVSV